MVATKGTKKPSDRAAGADEAAAAIWANIRPGSAFQKNFVEKTNQYSHKDGDDTLVVLKDLDDKTAPPSLKSAHDQATDDPQPALQGEAASSTPAGLKRSRLRVKGQSAAVKTAFSVEARALEALKRYAEAEGLSTSAALSHLLEKCRDLKPYRK